LLFGRGMIPALAPPASLLTRNTTAPISPALEALFASLDRRGRIPTVEDLNRCLSDSRVDLADILPHTATDRGGYVRTIVKRTERYESLVMCWLPGQKSPIHDHGTAVCGVRVIQGAATETLYTIARDGFADPFRRRVHRAGDVLSAGDDDVHALGNLPETSAGCWPVALVTLHVYAPRLENVRKFVERLPKIRRARAA
jgi:cysteine dioxygenase